MPVSALTPRSPFWPMLPPGHSCLFTVLLTHFYKTLLWPSSPSVQGLYLCRPFPRWLPPAALRPSLNKKPPSPAPPPPHALLGFPELLHGNFQRAVLYAVPQLCPELQRNCGTTGTAEIGTKPYGAGAAEGENWGPSCGDNKSSRNQAFLV